MAQSNRGSWGGKKDVKWQGGYIPPVLHSFLYNFKVLEVKQKKKEKKAILISRFKLCRAPQFLIWVTRGPFAGQVITCRNDVGCKNKATVISNLHIVCICTISLLFCPNSHSGLSYSLNTASLKAENSLNWLVYLLSVNAFTNSFILYYYQKKSEIKKKSDIFLFSLSRRSPKGSINYPEQDVGHKCASIQRALSTRTKKKENESESTQTATHLCG